MYRTDKVTPAPTSWSVVFARPRPLPRKVDAYNYAIYIADAALYLEGTKPDLEITDPYELTQPQFDAAVALLKEQRAKIGKYWGGYPEKIADFEQGLS